MADIAHELRTPLTVIQGRLEGLIDGVYPRDEARLTEVLNDTRMLARLVEDLRTLAHTESGTLALHKEPTTSAFWCRRW
jgi:signal transduction histidine kinase